MNEQSMTMQNMIMVLSVSLLSAGGVERDQPHGGEPPAAVSIIEQRVKILFGRLGCPEGATNSAKDEHIKICFGGSKRLALEVVRFISFLGYAESIVDPIYHFATN